MRAANKGGDAAIKRTMFQGAGKRRPRSSANEAEANRRNDAVLAERLLGLGLDPFLGNEALYVVRLDNEGADVEARGRRLRCWPVFVTPHASDHADRMVTYRRFLDGAGRANDPSYHVTIRPKGSTIGVPVEHYRQRHTEFRAKVGRAIEHGRDYYGVETDWAAVHARPRLGGAFLDLHIHIAARGGRLEGWVKYLGKVFDTVWSGDGRDLPAVLEYADRGAPVPAADFADENLATFLEQVEGGEGEGALHWCETYGEFRRFRGLARKDPRQYDEVIDEVTGERRWVPRPRLPRPRRNPSAPRTGERLLAVRLAWVGEVLVPVVIVRGYRGNFSALARAYGLDRYVRAAKRAMLHI